MTFSIDTPHHSIKLGLLISDTLDSAGHSVPQILTICLLTETTRRKMHLSESFRISCMDDFGSV